MEMNTLLWVRFTFLHGRGKASMAGASPATTIDGQKLSQRRIVVAPLAGAMKPHAKKGRELLAIDVDRV
jgi:hypothetical protein